MALGKGISVINGFDLNSKLPLDSRAVADTMEDMNKLVTDGSVGDGQLCYCKEDKKLYMLKDNVWSEVGGGGGKSVPPTLYLIDLETGKVRTTITEEEKTNIENGLYNQTIYISDYSTNVGDSYSPSKLFGVDGEYYFAQFNITFGEDDKMYYTSLSIYSLIIGTQDTSTREYSITIKKVQDILPNNSGGSSNLPVLDLSQYDADTVLTDAQITAIEDYSTKGFVNIKLPEPFNNILETLNIGGVIKKDGVDYKNSFIELYSSPIPNFLSGLFPIITLFRMIYEITDDKKLKLEYIEFPKKEGFSGDGVLIWDDAENKMRWKQLSSLISGIPTITFED